MYDVFYFTYGGNNTLKNNSAVKIGFQCCKFVELFKYAGIKQTKKNDWKNEILYIIVIDYYRLL